jgi:C-terminal processing protease CtpA/Prc
MSDMGLRTACVLGLVTGLLLGGCIIVTDRDDDWDTSSYTSSEKPVRLGVETAEPGKTLATQLNIDRSNATVIMEVRSNSCAERVGLQKYDIITAIDGSDDADPDDLRRALRGKEWGETITLTIVRSGQSLDVVVPLEKAEPRPTPYPS